MDRHSLTLAAVKRALACHDKWPLRCLAAWSLLAAIGANVAAHYLTGWPGLVLRFWWHCTRG